MDGINGTTAAKQATDRQATNGQATGQGKPKLSHLPADREERYRISQEIFDTLGPHVSPQTWASHWNMRGYRAPHGHIYNNHLNRYRAELDAGRKVCDAYVAPPPPEPKGLRGGAIVSVCNAIFAEHGRNCTLEQFIDGVRARGYEFELEYQSEDIYHRHLARYVDGLAAAANESDDDSHLEDVVVPGYAPPVSKAKNFDETGAMVRFLAIVEALGGTAEARKALDWIDAGKAIFGGMK